MNHEPTSIVIDAMGFSLSPQRILSSELEQRLSTVYERNRLSVGRLELMTGIGSRRFWNEPRVPSEIAAEAGAAALRTSNVALDRIDGVIHAAVCRDRLEPATAAYVHQRLGLRREAFFFDLSNACLGFLQAVDTARQMILSGSAQAVLVVAGEDGLPLIQHTLKVLQEGDWNRQTLKPFFANLTIGAGAVAAVVSRKDLVAGERGILLGRSLLRVDSQSCQLCEGGSAEGAGLQMQTDSEALLEAGIRLARATWDDFLQATGCGKDGFDVIIPHQVGRSHEKLLGERLGYPMERALLTYPCLGNIGSVSLPITLALGCWFGQVQPGQRIALMGIGSGLSCQMMDARCLAEPPAIGESYAGERSEIQPQWGRQ
jgi:3-oxoacyl-[acyl-carrier-protein] synthase III